MEKKAGAEIQSEIIHVLKFPRDVYEKASLSPLWMAGLYGLKLEET